MNRRRALKALGAGGAALAGARAVDNVLLGYGVLVGTNLREQDLAALATEAFEPTPFETVLGGVHVAFDGETIRVADGDRERVLDPAEASLERAAGVDAAFGLPGDPIEAFVADLRAFADGDVSFAFASYEPFFDRLEAVETRPLAVESLRNRRWGGVDPDTVARFAGVEPTDTPAVVEGLAEGFREHTRYDVARYLAGSIEDNVLLGAVDLREAFASPASFEAIEAGENDGMFCWEYTYRSIEALQAVPAHRQTVPAFGSVVYDARHGHVYTAVGSAYRANGELVVPVTFLDYARTTLYDDFRLRGLLGDGLDAYGTRRRASTLDWP